MISVDDRFPCGNRGPVFSRSKENEIWVMLIEKVYAKIYGSYANIEAGRCINAFRDLTGAPAEVFVPTIPNDMWKYLVANHQKGFLFTASSSGNDSNSSKRGIV